MITEIELVDDNKVSSEEILRKNIDKANLLLDHVMDIVLKNNYVSSKMLASLAGLIDSVSNAAEKLLAADNDFESLLLKQSAIALKQRELDFKMAVGQKPNTVNQNIIVSSREDLLKLINGTKRETPDDSQQ
jgi:hypothetical protein